MRANNESQLSACVVKFSTLRPPAPLQDKLQRAARLDVGQTHERESPGCASRPGSSCAASPRERQVFPCRFHQLATKYKYDDEGASRDTSCAAGGTSAPAAARLGRRLRRAQRQRCAFQGWPIACRWWRVPCARSRAFGHRLRSEARALLTFLLPCSRVESGGRGRSKAGPCGAVVSARDAHAALFLRRAWLGRRATA